MAALSPFLVTPAAAFGQPVCRLGLASHGKTALQPDDVLLALDRGVNFLSWAGAAWGFAEPEAVGQAIGTLGARRSSVVVCVQLAARTADEAHRELAETLCALRTDYLDVVVLSYLETAEEWERVHGPGGALDLCGSAKRDGVIRRIAVSSHQRLLAADMASTGTFDLLMIRYNAAHRGAEREVFPVTTKLGMPVIPYTALRWGALLETTPSDPPGFEVPKAPDWYRFVLQSPAVSVVLAAPHNRAELEENLAVLEAQGPMEQGEYERLAEHGLRVRKNAGAFR